MMQEMAQLCMRSIVTSVRNHPTAACVTIVISTADISCCSYGCCLPMYSTVSAALLYLVGRDMCSLVKVARMSRWQPVFVSGVGELKAMNKSCCDLLASACALNVPEFRTKTHKPATMVTYRLATTGVHSFVLLVADGLCLKLIVPIWAGMRRRPRI
ncbi:hypothetical protein COO60DRAFT_560384 [Scenedesmus sp. NREL 46B-D3]|nr:hypothetical protein COO60DRAFT_560384 [Scenedesmus sp. NREL 46B-D3]